MNTAEADQALTLAEKDLDSLTPYGHEHTVKRGEALWQAGHHPDTLFLIRSGKANIRVTTGEGREAIVQYCARPDVLHGRLGHRQSLSLRGLCGHRFVRAVHSPNPFFGPI